MLNSLVITEGQQAAPNTLNVQAFPNATVPGVYTAPVNHAIAGFNQVMMKHAEVFDPFIQASLITQPRHWLNVIPRGSFPNFNGITHETRVFRGGLQLYAGLSEWSQINPIPSNANNPSVGGGFATVPYAWERFEWTGYQTYWGSDPISVDSLQYTQQAQEQLAWILQVGADYGISIQEVWNRDWLIKSAVDAGRSYLMTSSYVGNTAAPRFYYEPRCKFIAAADFAASTHPYKVNSTTTGLTKPFIVFPAGVEIEPLNFDVLDMLHMDFDASCPTAALGNSSGSPLYGLPISKFDFERYIKGNPYELTNWREARAEKLITGMTDVKTHRDYALSFDANQLRFAIKTVVSDYDSSNYAGVASDLDGTTVVIAEYVAPRIAGRVGENNQQIPEWNPEYGTAELAVTPIMLNRVFTNLMGSDITTLGSGTYFGPQPGLNGKWAWLNILDKTTNPYGKIGNFVGEFKLFPKIEPNVVFSTAFLYRRCAEAIRSRCPLDNAEVNPDTMVGSSADAVSCVGSAANATADTFTAVVTLAKKLVDAPVGKLVTLTFSGLAEDVAVSGYLVKTSAAPVYTIHVTASGVMDILAAAPSNGTAGYYLVSGVLTHKAVDTTVTLLTLDSVSL
ncbi:MAG: hypothetical protein FJ279_00470 [Planctomycetes bacterium]|nr:hypothetical protein [Planctomycetota bacterium]